MCRRSRGSQAPIGQFINVPRYPPADYRGVSAPNADTLYSVAWLDLAEPQVFSHPDMGDRFYLFEVTDLWMSDSETSPSKRTADGKAANYLFTGPGWKGAVPAGMKHFRSRLATWSFWAARTPTAPSRTTRPSMRCKRSTRSRRSPPGASRTLLWRRR